MGNIRLSYTENSFTGEVTIMEKNHYYPFGLKHKAYNTQEYLFNMPMDGSPGYSTPVLEQLNSMPNPYQYKFNGKELQDELGLNIYDYGARNYDPAIGRWSVIDPLAEKMRRFSPYTYAWDNPMIFVDYDGMFATPPTDYFNLNGKKVKHVEDGKTDKTSKEQGFLFGQNGESSKTVTGTTSKEIKSAQWREAEKDLTSKGDTKASDAHLHPLEYDKNGTVTMVGTAKPSDTDKAPENLTGNTQPSMVFGFTEEIERLPSNQMGGTPKVDYVPTVGFYNEGGSIIQIPFSDLKSTVKKINK